jgi:hypothetical protein
MGMRYSDRIGEDRIIADTRLILQVVSWSMLLAYFSGSEDCESARLVDFAKKLPNMFL